MPSGCRIPRTDSSVSLVFHAGGFYHPGHTVTMFGTNTTNWRMLLLEDSAGFYLMNNTSHTSLCSFNRCGLWVPHHPQHQITQNQQLQVYKVKLKALSSVKCLKSPKSLKVWWCVFVGKICSASQRGNTRKGWIHAPPGIGCQAAAHAWNGTGKASTTWRVMLA